MFLIYDKGSRIPSSDNHRGPTSHPCRGHSPERQLLRGRLQLQVFARHVLPEPGQRQSGPCLQAGLCPLQEEQTPLWLHILHGLESSGKSDSDRIERQDYKADQIRSGADGGQ